MKNLWEIIAKARGVELDEEFLYSLSNFEYKYRISERGLEYYDDGGRWTFSECSSEFIKGIGRIEKLPFTPRIGEYYWTYSAGVNTPVIAYYYWGNNCYDKERKLLGIIFKTEQEALNYLLTWEKRLEGEEV